MPLVGSVPGSVLLDLAQLHSEFCDVEAWKFLDLNGIKLRGVASPLDIPKGTRQSSISGFIPGQSKADLRARALHADKVPARIADHSIENRRAISSMYVQLSPNGSRMGCK
jgi:hypothetical protein